MLKVPYRGGVAQTDVLEDFVALTDVALRRRMEPAHGLFIAEGTQVATRALACGFEPRTMVVIPERAGREDVRTLADGVRAASGSVHQVPSADLRVRAGFDVHRGVMVSFSRRPQPSMTAVASSARTLAVLEGIVDHTNVGAIIRSAAALGVDGIVLDPRCADPLYRRAIRTSMGAVFSVPYARCSSWPGGLRNLAALGFTILGLTPHAADCDLAELHVGANEKVAILLGTEGAGLSAAALRLATARVAIGMREGVDSLNVATAAALACWAVERARSGAVGQPSVDKSGSIGT